MTIQTIKCPDCGGPLAPSMARCPHCGQYVERDAARTTPQPAGGQTAHGVLFERAAEPNEGAFTFSIPKGWLIKGGIMRANLMHQVIDAQSIEAKLDLTVKRDPAGTVMIRWCPEIKYCDVRMSPAGMMGMFPVGSNYQGMQVCPLMPAVQFLTQIVYPWAHPQAERAELVAQQNVSMLCQNYQQKMAALRLPAHFAYDGGIVTFRYVEEGISFLEKAQVVIENMGPMAGGMWSNKDTVLARSPDGEFAAWEPILHHIQESVQLNWQWLAREIVNQEFLSRQFLNAQQAAIARDRRMLEIQQQMQTVDRQIAEHRTRTNAEIHNDAYLTLMDQEEYVNPTTNRVETGSNQWQHRWVTGDGDEYYTDNEDWDPNGPGYLNRSDWQRTPVRRRFPQ